MLKWLPLLRTEPFSSAPSLKQLVGEWGGKVYRAEVPGEWRAIFSIDPEHHVVALHILADHENIYADANRNKVRNQLARGLHLKAPRIPYAEPSSSPTQEETIPKSSQVPWIPELDLEDMEIAPVWWAQIQTLAQDGEFPDLEHSGLPPEIISPLEVYCTEPGNHLDRLYEARLVGGVQAPMVALQLRLDPSQEAAKQSLLKADRVFMVRGGPGTGKSTVLLDYIVTLARRKARALGHQPELVPGTGQRPVGLLTFNWELRDRHIEDVGLLAPELKPAMRVKEVHQDTRLVISNLDTWVTRPVMVNVLGYARKAIEGDQEMRFLKSRIQAFEGTHPEEARRLWGLIDRAGEEYLLDEINLMLLGWDFPTYEAYKGNRAGKGRKLGFQASESHAVWFFGQAYLDALEASEPKLWTWSSGRRRVLHALQTDEALRETYRLDLLGVDEAQDMTPVMIRIILELVGGERAAARLRFCSDPGQCLYGPPLKWKQIHREFLFGKGRAALLDVAHRSGQAILDATHFLRLAKDDGEDEEVPKAKARRQGEKPTLLWASQTHHLKLLGRWWREKWIGKGRSAKDVAILCRNHQQAQEIRAELGFGAYARDTPVRTLHQARGQGWPTIIIPFLAESTFPPENQRKGLQGQEAWREAMEEERSLLYVGLTRASHQAILLADPHDRSQLLDRLEEQLWDIKHWSPNAPEVTE